MAGKSGSLHGAFYNGTPFQFHEENRVAGAWHGLMVFWSVHR